MVRKILKKRVAGGERLGYKEIQSRYESKIKELLKLYLRSLEKCWKRDLANAATVKHVSLLFPLRNCVKCMKGVYDSRAEKKR